LRSERGSNAETAVLKIAGRTLALGIPQTYVNDSGLAVRALTKRYLAAQEGPGSGEGGRGQGRLLFAPGSLVIIHDELDLEPGVVRVKVGGGTAGHNGLRSIQSHLHDLEFTRIRIGVGKPPSAAAGKDYVLKRASRADRALIEVAIEVAADAVESLLADGPEATLNRFNTRA
jgi:PTH1 family peptidyl-tRNA hydrolase